ncbi:hypothetical protein B0H17DRAFT_1326640, partial [Mycena rosella]
MRARDTAESDYARGTWCSAGSESALARRPTGVSNAARLAARWMRAHTDADAGGLAAVRDRCYRAVSEEVRQASERDDVLWSRTARTLRCRGAAWRGGRGEGGGAGCPSGSCAGVAATVQPIASEWAGLARPGAILALCSCAASCARCSSRSPHTRNDRECAGISACAA